MAWKRTCKNPDCRSRYMPTLPRQKACSPECAVVVGRIGRDKKLEAIGRSRLRKERQDDKEARERLSTINQLLASAQAEVNRYVRLRDHFDGCISCDKPPEWGGQWHASHFKSRGSNASLRFNLLNIHKSCSECNGPKHGNLLEYRERLILKKGQPLVDWLESHPRSRRYDRDYLLRLKKVFSKKSNILEKRLGLR